MDQALYTMVARTFFGLEDVLAEEIKGIGGQNVCILRRAVSFEGDMACMYKANLWLRTAISVLKHTDSFYAKNETTLYDGIKKINWPSLFNVKETIAIHSVVSSPYFKHSKFPALKAKDAIADLFREQTGQRPSVDTKDPGIVINVHIADDKVTVSMDSSGPPLFKRGYRKYGETAPLNEVLAAGLVMLSDWDRKSVLIDFMCGSGTILIEAGMIAGNIPPGMLKQNFAFKHWNDYDDKLWKNIIAEAGKSKKKDYPKLIGNDRFIGAVRAAQQNIKQAGLDDMISVKHSPFDKFQHGDEKGWIITNPPYGQRLKNDEIESLYQDMGSTLKHQYPGFKAWILSGNPDALKNIGLKHTAKIKLFNGPLECSFRKYELYEGSKKGGGPRDNNKG